MVSWRTPYLAANSDIKTEACHWNDSWRKYIYSQSAALFVKRNTISHRRPRVRKEGTKRVKDPLS